MATEPELELLDERPRQFGLIHLMTLLTVLALAFALLAPLVRSMSSHQAVSVVAILAIEVVVFAGSYFHLSLRRERLLAKAGRRVGQSHFGMAKSRAFGRFATAIGFFFFAIVQVAVSITMIMMANDTFPWFMVISQVQLGIFAGYALMQLRSGRDVGAIEFFEHGIADATQLFTPWDQVVVRPSTLYPHGVNLHIRHTIKQGGATMSTVFVSDELKQYLLKHHGDEAE